MVTTIRALMERYHQEPAQTVYRHERGEVLDYPLAVGDFFECLQGLDKGKNYYEIYEFYRACRQEEQKCEIAKLHKQVRQSLKQSEMIKIGYHGPNKKALLRELKKQRRAMRQELAVGMEEIGELVRGQFGDEPEKLRFFEYKNRALLTSFENISAMVPKIGASKRSELRGFPWLTTGLCALRRAVRHGEELGIVGGPCLFGIDEVLLQVETYQGARERFDCSCGSSCTGHSGQQELTLREYLGLHRQQVSGLHIINRKTGLTRQEYLGLLYVFEIAALLGGKAVIPLPDLSYLKYMADDTALLDQPLRQQVMAEFEAETYQVTDLFLEAIDCLKRQYPEVAVTVLHNRDQDLCRQFYEKREPFLRDSQLVRKLTGVNGKKEAVTDYITMPALPYYLDGIRHIVQVDSLDEADTGRKCQKIHKEEIHLYSLLYPEFISRDGVNTIYNAKLEFKDYMRSEEYGR